MNTSILVADDFDQLRSIICTLIKSRINRGVTIFEASNARSAMDIVESTKIDLAILDICMDGYGKLTHEEFLMAIKTNVKFAMLMTASQDFGIMLTARRIGFRGIIHKGTVSPIEAINIIESILDGGSSWPKRLC